MPEQTSENFESTFDLLKKRTDDMNLDYKKFSEVLSILLESYYLGRREGAAKAMQHVEECKKMIEVSTTYGK